MCWAPIWCRASSTSCSDCCSAAFDFFSVTIVGLVLCSTALFVSFSRGAWGAAVFAIVLMAVFSIVTADSHRMRFRIMRSSIIMVFAIGVGVLGVLSDETVREFFFKRASATQEYDEGPTGRFGNQLRSMPMLVERPNGIWSLAFSVDFRDRTAQ